MYLFIDLQDLVLCFGEIIELLPYNNILFVNEQQVFSLEDGTLYENIEVPSEIQPLEYYYIDGSFYKRVNNDLQKVDS